MGIPAEPRGPIKEVWLAALLSIVATGLGEMYAGQETKGLVLLLAYIATVLLSYATCGCFAIVWFPLWVLGIADSVMIAQRINRGEVVSEWQFF